MRLSSLILIICALALLFPAFATAAESRGDYLALGDSLAFGLDPFRPAADWSDPTGFVGYPEVLAKTLDLDLTNASCPGEASGGFISLTGVDRRCRTFYRARFPLHVGYTTSQLDFAVAYLRSHPRTRLVTLNLGGNDLSLLVERCAGERACVTNGLPALLGTLAGNLKTIYAGIRDDGRYQGRITLLSVGIVPALVACTLVRAAGAEGGELWVTSQGTNRLLILRGQTVAETLQLPAGTGPHITTFSPDGKDAYVGSMGNGDLDVLRAAERRLVATLHLGPAGTHQAKPSPDGTIVLVSQLASKSLIKVTADPAAETWRVAGALRLEVLGKTPICTVFRDDGERAYVSLLPNGVAVVDVATMTLRNTLATDGFVACGMIKSKDGKTVTLAAAGGGGHVYRLDTATDELSDAGTLGASSWHSFNMSPNERVGYGTSPMSDELVLADLRAPTVGALGTVSLHPTAGVGTDQPDAIAVRGDTVFVSLRASGKLAVVQANQRTASYIDISAPTPFDPATCAGCAVHGVTVRPDGR